MKKRPILTAMTKRLSMHHLIRLGIIAAVLVCLLTSLLFPSVAAKLVHAQNPNFDGVTLDVNRVHDAGHSLYDYNLTDNWGGKWCDAEKTLDDTDDDEMCWAAAASNVLEWTGWGFVNHPIEGEMTNCDQMFEHFNDHWEDKGADVPSAWVWWFNGTDISGGAHVDVPGGGNFWPTYNFGDYYHRYAGNDTLQHIDEFLSSGYGVAIGIFDGGHAITIWGIRYDDNFNKTTQPRDYYKGVWATDSDDNKNTYSWTPPPNVLRYYNVSFNSGVDLWQLTRFGGLWNISDVIALEKNPFLEPDLVIYKTAYPDVVMAGEELFYNITVVNANRIPGGVTAYNVVVTDTLPAGVTYISDTGGCILWEGTTYNCSLGDIAPGDSRSFIIKVMVWPDYVISHGNAITNTANVTSDTVLWESDLTNNEVTVTSFVQDLADLKVMKFCKPDTRVLAGELINYTIIVDNLGPSCARNVTIEDTILSSGKFTLVSVTSDLPADLWPLSGEFHDVTILGLLNGTLYEFHRWTVRVTVQANEALDINNDVSVFTTALGTPDPDMSNNQAEQSISVTPEPADLKVIKFVKPDTAVLAGQLINYTIIVENLGPSIAYNVSIRDQILSSGSFQVIDVITDSVRNDAFSYVTPSPGKTIEFDLLEPLEPKNSTGRGRWVLQIILRANETQDIDNVVNVFTRTSRTFDPELSNNEAQTSIHVNAAADLRIQKTATPAYLPYPKKTLTYTIIVTNNGPSTATNVIIRDWLPGELLCVNSVTSTKGSCNFGVPGDPLRPALCTVGSLMPGESVTMVISVTLKTSNVRVNNDASVSSDIFDPDNSNNLASLSVLAGSASVLTSSVDLSSTIAIALMAPIGLASSMVAIRKKKIDLLSLVRKRLEFLKKTNTT